MDLPHTLPARLYLLAYQPARGRLAQRSDVGLLLRAAALTDLLQRGLLIDQDGAPQPNDPAPTGLDPVLARVLEQIAASRRRSWQHWVGADHRGTHHAVRDQLAQDGYLDLEERRALGLFPVLRAVPRDPEVRERLLARFNAALTDPLPQVEPRQAALVPLAAEGRLHHLLTGRQRRAHRERIRELAATAGPVPRALRRALTARHSTASG